MLQVLDRTKVLYGPWTQASRETNYLEERLQVFGRIKALYGPRTQAFGKTNYLEETVRGWTRPGRYVAPVLGVTQLSMGNSFPG